MRKRSIAIVLAGILTVLSPVAAFADSTQAKTDVPYVSLGADLNQQERATVLKLLGVTENDLKNYTVATVTNAEEHDYLDSYLSQSVIGSGLCRRYWWKGRRKAAESLFPPATLPIVRQECMRMLWPQPASRTLTSRWQDL